MGNKLGNARGEDTHTQSRFHLTVKTPTERLLMAICKGDVSAAREAIIAGAEVDWRASGAYGGTPLHAAAMKGRADVVKMLVSAGATVDARERKYGRTPLMEAAWYGHPAALQVLLESGASIEMVCDALGRTALSLAADKGADPRLKAWNADPEADMGPGKGARECLQILLERGADPNSCDQAGKTALHWAASQGNGECCNLLIQHGADINARDSLFQRTPLHYACQNAQPSSYEVLAAMGADPSIQDVKGQTPHDCEMSCMLQGSLGGAPVSMLDQSIPVPTWDEIHGEADQYQYMHAPPEMIMTAGS